MGEEEHNLLTALEQIRRDKHQPWRYIGFTFLNGVAQGLGIALGTTLFLGVVIWLFDRVLSHLVGFPVLGSYASDMIKLLNSSVHHGHHTSH